MRIWAHRGCSQMYPENTITAFEQAMNIPGIAGIELDIQLTRDGELVVIHDEKVDRTTDVYGNVRDFSLKELSSFHIHTGSEKAEHIPTMREVFELLAPKLRRWKPQQAEDPRIDVDFGNQVHAACDELGMRLNIELKNSIIRYPGMEEKIVNMVHEFGVEKAVVYSTFHADSLLRVHELDPDAELGVLDNKVSDCLYKALGLERTIEEMGLAPVKFALHPYGNKMDIERDRYSDRIVRAWYTGHLYPEKPTGGRLDIPKYESLSITDIFLNEPDKYLTL